MTTETEQLATTASGENFQLIAWEFKAAYLANSDRYGWDVIHAPTQEIAEDLAKRHYGYAHIGAYVVRRQEPQPECFAPTKSRQQRVEEYLDGIGAELVFVQGENNPDEMCGYKLQLWRAKGKNLVILEAPFGRGFEIFSPAASGSTFAETFAAVDQYLGGDHDNS